MNKRYSKSLGKDKNLIIISIKSFYQALINKLILFLSKIGQKTNIKTLKDMRFQNYYKK